MKKNATKNIVLAIYIVIVSFAALKLYDDNNKMFSIIGWIATIVLGTLGINVPFSNNSRNDIVHKLEKQIKDKEAQIEQLKELREYYKEKIIQQEKEIKSLEFRSKNNEYEKQIRKLKAENTKKKKEYDINDAQITQLSANRYELEKQLNQVIEIKKQIEEVGSVNNNPLYRKAYNFFIKGNIDKALNILSDRKLEKLNDFELWYFKSRLFNIKNNKEEAHKCFIKAIELDPDFIKTHTRILPLGLTRGYKSGLTSAFYNYVKDIYLKPNFTEDYHNTENECKNKKIMVSLGVGLGGSACRLAETLNNMGNIYYHEGNYNKAIEYYEKAISLNLNFENPYRNMAELYQSIGNQDKANDYIQKANMIRNNVT